MNVPVIALRGLTVLPGQVVHFDAGRKISIEAAQKAMASGQKVLLTLQKDISVEIYLNMKISAMYLHIL